MSEQSPSKPNPPVLPVTPTPDEPVAKVTATPPDEAALEMTAMPPDEAATEVALVPDPPNPAGGPEKDEMLTEFWETVKRLPRYVRLAALMAGDPEVPRTSKALLAAGGAYAIVPIDLVPGVIPVAGQVDDLYVILSALRQAIRSCPNEVVQKHLTEADVTAQIIDADLALVRKMVRRGVSWTLRNGRKALAGASRYAGGLIRERRGATPGSGGS